MVGWMPYRSQRAETGVCSRRWSRRMAAFSWTGSRFRVFLGMGGPPLEVVAYSSRRLVPFQLKQNTLLRGIASDPCCSQVAALGNSVTGSAAIAGPATDQHTTGLFLRYTL